MVTFTGSNGQRIKNISHKNLWFHTKDSPMLVRWGNTGDGVYGPWAAFEVHGDTSGEYMYKPGKDAPDNSFWAAMEQQIKTAKGEWVLCHTTFDGDYPALVLEDEAGMVLPGETVQSAVKELDLEPVNPEAERLVAQANRQMATGTPRQADEALFLKCAVSAGKIVDAFQEHLGRPMTDADQKIATALFIQAK